MKVLISPMSVVGSLVSALRYELARLRGVRSMRGVVLLAFAGSVLLTLTAARQVTGLGHPLGLVPPLPRSAVVGGGVAGVVLPGIAAAWAAAWFGATSIGYEYRHGNGLLTFALVPRRGCVLIAKVGVAAGFGALLCLGTTVVAYGTAWLGFRFAGTRIDLPAVLLVPGLRAAAVAALGGALGVFGGAVLRSRVLATVTALAGCVLVAAFLPRSSSLALPYLAQAARYVVRAVPGMTYATVMNLLLALPLAVLVLLGLVAVRRRRVA